MFGDKISQFYHMPKWKETCMTMIREPDGTAMLDPIWFTSHEETAIENQQLMSAVFQKMETGGCSYCDLSTRLPEKSECCFQGCVCGKTGEILPDIGRDEDKNCKDYGVCLWKCICGAERAFSRAYTSKCKGCRGLYRIDQQGRLEEDWDPARVRVAVYRDTADIRGGA